MAETSPAPVSHDLAEVVARFGAALRLAGLGVGPDRCERFASSVTISRPQSPGELYLCALATLVSGRDQIETLRAVFYQVFGGLADQGRPGGPDVPGPGQRASATPEDLLARAAQVARA